MKNYFRFVLCVSAGVAALIISLPAIIAILKATESDTYFLLPYGIVVITVFAAVLIAGISCAVKASQLAKGGDIRQLSSMWQGMKLFCIPAYIINFTVCVIAGFAAILLFPMNAVMITVNSLFVVMCVILSGFVGAIFFNTMKKAGRKIHPVCCVMQFIPFWDVVTTLFIKGKERL